MQQDAHNFYNENDPKAAAWLRCLIAEGLIPNGHVDERSIEQIEPADVQGYVQCHFFAGIGGWSEALRLSMWPNDVSVWTGSCPCQPLSSAGKRAGEMDERHLWPDFYRLIAECRPATIFGEQVASNDGLEWLDGVSLDLEELGYAVGAADLPAACVGKPHQRQRLFWCANLHGAMPAGEMRANGAANAIGKRPLAEAQQAGNRRFPELVAMGIAQRAPAYAEARRLVDGIPGWMAQMRGFGNAIVPGVAAKFVRACIDGA